MFFFDHTLEKMSTTKNAVLGTNAFKSRIRDNASRRRVSLSNPLKLVLRVKPP
jgi:hypothetical protein